LSKHNYPELAYEWSNYRHAIGRVNGCKGNLDDLVLDPFEVEDDWFAIQIPDLQLVLTDRIRTHHPTHLSPWAPDNPPKL
jgi:hypothetical protein